MENNNYQNKRGSTFSRWLLSMSCVALCLFAFTANAANEYSLSATGGTTSATYSTLGAAFTAINAGTHTGVITISITANPATTEGTTPATLNSSGAGSASYTSVSIRPAVDGVTISGNPVTGFGVIQLNGADNVTIDGDNPNTAGTNRNLTVSNTTTATVIANSAIRIATSAAVTSADNNTIKNCALLGNVTGGNISSITSSTGSSNSSFGIYCGGNGGATATGAPTAITSVTSQTAPSGTTINNLTIDNNSINQCARAIVFNGAATSVSTGTLTITNNVIGGSGSLTGAPPYTTPSSTVYTKGMFLAGFTSASITGNTIQNLLSYVATALNGIEFNSAVGTVGGTVVCSNNTITGVVNNSSANVSAPNGIIVSSCAAPYTFAGNTISNIQNVGTGSVTALNISSSSAASGLIEKNQCSFVYTRNTSGYAARGIWVQSGNAVTIQNNMVWDLNAVANNSTTSTSFGVYGIQISGGLNHKVYHNSVNLNNTFLTGGTSADPSACFGISASTLTGIDVRNNLFSNTMSGGNSSVNACLQIPSGATSAMNLTLNNNAYYTGSGALNYLAITASTLNTFTAANFVPGSTAGATNWRNYSSTLLAANTNNDNASFSTTSAAPFISATNLHLDAASAQLANVEQKGASGLGVTTDIDGQTRPNTGTTFPDMGADEVATALCSAANGGTISPSTASACAGGTATMTSTGVTTGTGITYQWMVSTTSGSGYVNVTGGSGATTTSYTTGTLTAGTYYYVLQTTCSAGPLTGLSNELTVTVNSLPTVAVSPTSGTYCSPGGSAVSLTASGATTYAWSPSSGLSATTGASVNASPSAGTTYTVVGTDANGCTASATAAISTNLQPSSVAATATPSAVCSGGSSVLAATNSPILANTYAFNGSVGSYSAISGTVLGAGVIGDDVGIGNLPIGFTFNYNGTAQTVFGVSSNGFIQLGNTSATFTGFSSNALSSTALVIAGLWDDNNTTGSTVQYATTGAVGSRVLTVQWTAMHVAGGGSSTNPTIDMQIKLYEATGVAQIIYGSTSATLSSPTASIGISGASGNFISVTPASPATASTASIVTENGSVSNSALFPSGTTYTFTPAVFTYTWSPSTFLSGTTGASVTASGVTSTTAYTVTVSNGACSATASATVSLASALSLAVNSPSICSGTSGTLTAVPAGGAAPFTYSWTPGTDLSATTGVSVTATPSASTQYTVTVTDNCGTSASAISSVTVNPTPTASIAPSGSVTYCSNAIGTLTASTSGVSPSYQWKLNGSPIGGATLSTYVPTGSGSYTVTITDGPCSSTSAATVVTVNQTPSSVGITPGTSLICTSGSQTLTASGGTVPANAVIGTGTIQNGTSTTTDMPVYGNYYSGNRHQILVKAAELSAAGLVAGSSINSVAFDVVSNSNALGYQNFNIAIGASSATALTTTFETSATTLVYTSSNYNPTPGLNVHTFSTPFVWNGTSNILVESYFSNCGLPGSSCSGTTCTGSGSGVTYTQNAVVNNTTTAYVSHSYYYSDGTSCNPNTIATASTTSSNRPNMVFGFTKNPTWSWSPNTSDVTAAVSVSPTSTTVYTATATINGCSSSATATVNFNAPTVSISGTNTICTGGSTTLTATASGATTTYQWYNGASPISGETSSTLVVNAPGTYSVQVVTDGCPATSSAYPVTMLQYTITASAGSNGSISPSGAVTVDCGTSQSFTITPDAGYQIQDVLVDGVSVGAVGNYTFSNVTAAHTIAASFIISPCLNPATASAGSNATICGGTYTLGGSIGGTATSATWSTSGDGTFNSTVFGTGTTYTPGTADIAAGTVTITLTTNDPDGAGSCTPAVSSLVLTVGSVPTVSLATNCATLLGGNSATLTTTASASPATITTYAYTLNGTTSVGPNAATYTTPQVGSYTVTVTSSVGCSATSSAVVISASGPLSGAYTIGGSGCTNYATFAAAVNDLNTKGVSGNVTITVAGGYTETVPAGGLVLKQCALAVGLQSGPTQTVTFISAGGTNPKLTANTGTTTANTFTDNIVKVVGMDNVTFNGIDLSENAANTTATTQMEAGLGVYKCDGANGSNNVTYTNGVITLNRANGAAIGVRVANTTDLSSTSLTYTGTAGSVSAAQAFMNRVSIATNTITNTNGAALFNASTASTGATISLNDTLNAFTGNTVTNFGGNANALTVVSYNDNRGIICNNNNFNSVAATTTGALTIINGGSGPHGSINGNTISVSPALTTAAFIGITWGSSGTGNTSSISNNTIQNCSLTAATTSTFTGITSGLTGTNAVTTMNGNTITGNTLAGTGTFTGLANTGAPLTLSMSNNIITNNTKSVTGTMTLFTAGSPSAGGASTYNSNNISGNTITGGAVACTINCMVASGASGSAYTLNGNTVNNNTITALSAGVGTITGFSNAGSATGETITNNTFSNLTVGGASTSTHSIRGIVNNTLSTTARTVSGNTVFNLATLQAASSGTITGIISSAAATANYFNNKIYDLNAGGSASVITGISITSGTTVNVYNNLIGNLTSTGANTANAIIGISATGGTNVNLSFNTIRIAGTTSGGSSGISASATPTTVTLRNNIVYNGFNAGGTGLAVGFRRAAAALTQIGSATNNNLYYTGATATTPVYYDGTTAQATLANYKAVAGLAPREANSVFENVSTFASTTGSSAQFLHFTAGASTLAESGGISVAGITTDYDADTRATTPDIGADEFAGTAIQPAISSVSASPSGTQCAATARTITVVVVPGATAVTGVNLSYSYNGGAPTTVAMTGGPLTWTGTIPAATPVNATVTYSVVATDGTYNAVASGVSYADAPLTGVTLAATATPSTVCAGSSSTLSAAASIAGTATIGAGSTTNGSSGSPFYHGWGGSKTQFIWTAAELQAAGLTAGNITAYALNVTTTGTSYANFAISIASTSQSAFATANTVTASYQQVFTSASYTPTSGVNTFTFSTPFFWNGTSNIVISTCWSNVNTGGTSTTVSWDTYGTNVGMYIYADSQTAATMCAATTTVPASGGSATQAARPRAIFSGNRAPSTTFSWSDGTSTVGTGSSLAVTPSATTIYTATATDANGCSLTAAATVTVVPLPATPTATPSTQCGTGTPTASVAGTGGSFRWYTVATGGSAIVGQIGSTLSAYPISTTTTFYVSEFDGFCESPRTMVIATVTTPPSVTATSSVVSSTCPFTNFTLSATSPNDPNYAYTWTASPALGSGIPTSVTGANPTIQATAGGTYIYTVSAVDISTPTPTGCATSATTTVIVTAPPVVSSATAVPSTICSGSPVVLTATTPVVTPGTVTLGTGSIVNSTTAYPTPYGAYYGSSHEQYLITAAELAATGMAAGPLTSLAFELNGGYTFAAMAGYQIQIAHTNATALTTTPISTGFTTVYGPTTYTPPNAAGFAPVTFSTPFNWNGTSNLVVDVWFSNCSVCNGTSSCTTSFTNNGVVKQTSTSYASTYNVHADGNCTINSFTPSVTGTVYNQRANMRFGSNTVSNGAGTLTWTWNPGSLSGNTVTVNPTATTASVLTYTVQAFDAATGCSNFVSVPVTVNPLPATLTATPSVQCGPGVPSCSVSGGGGGIIRWYLTSTGGSPIAGETGTTLTSYSISAPTTFYVAEFDGTCEGARVAVFADEFEAGPVTLTASTPACLGSSITLTANDVTGYGYVNYTLSCGTAGSGLVSPQTGLVSSNPQSFTITPTAAGTYTYTYLATDGTCSASGTATVTVGTLPLINAVTTSTTSVCSGGDVVLTANTISGGPQVLPTGYPTVGTSTNNADEQIFGVTFGSMVNNQTETCTSNYTDYSGTIAAQTVAIGDVVSFAVRQNECDGATYYNNGFSIFIDYNRDGDFADAGEKAYTTTATSAATGVSPAGDNVRTGTITIPMTASAGLTKMRVVLAEGVVSPAFNEGFTYGEAEDYAVNILSISAGPYNWSWSPSGSTGATVTVNPTSTGAYTVTATDPTSGCTSTAVTPVITVNPLPSAPTLVNNSSQCGTGIPTATVMGSGGGLNWYLTPTGGVALPGETGGTLTAYSISTTTTFYVAEFDGLCESLRTMVIANVTPAPTTSITASSPTCQGSPITLTLNDGAGFFTGTNYSLNGTAGGGIASPMTGTWTSTSQTVSVTPTGAGSITYTLTSTGGGCTSVVSTTVTVTAAPVILSATASPTGSVCAGTTVTLTGLTGDYAPGLVSTGGAGTGSIGGNEGNPYRSGNGTGNQIRTQILVRASELTAAGMAPGNITSLAFTTTSASSGTMSNFSIAMGHTSATALTTTFETTPVTTVYTLASFTPAATGLNVHTFSTPFFWNGTSNLLINVCQTNNVLGTATVVTETVAFNATTHKSGSTTGCTDLTGSSSLTTRPIMRFGAQTGSQGPGTLSWVWNPGSLSGNVAVINPTTVGVNTYTVTATDPTSGCSSTASVTVNVLAVPGAPTATPSTQCGIGVPTASVAGSGGSFQWYLVPVGGSPIAGETGSTLSAYSISTTTTFYVAEFDGTCPGERAMVIATVTTPDVVTAASSLSTVCGNAPITLTATNTGTTNTYTYSWSAAAGSGITGSTAGNPITVTPTAGGTYTYVVTATDATAGCVTTASVAVTVTAPPVITTATANPTTVCLGTSTTLSATALIGSTGTVTVGTQGTTSIVGGPYRSGLCADYKTQYLYTVADLTAAGLVAGQQISSIGFNVTAVGSGAMPNWKISIGNTSATTLTTAYDAGATTTVYGPTTLTVAATGVNTYPFTTPFTWNGTSNIIVQVCHDNTCSGSSTIAMQNITGFNTYDNGIAGACAGSSTGNVNTMRPVTTFGYSSIDITSTYGWVWNPGAMSGSTVTTTPTSTGSQTYTVTATDPSTGCTSTAAVAVNVISTPPTPIISSSTTSLCGPGSATLTVTNATPGAVYQWQSSATGLPGSYTNIVGAVGSSYVASVTTPTYYQATVTCASSTDVSNAVFVDVVSPSITTINGATRCGVGSVTVSVAGNGSFDWFANSSGGSALATNTATYTTIVTGTTTFWVQAYIGTCLDPAGRQPVTVTVNPAPAITITNSGSNTICSGTTLTLTATSSNDPNYTYGWSTDGTTILATTAAYTVTPMTTTTYFVGAVDNTTGTFATCQAVASITIVVNASPTVNPTASVTSICNAGTTVNLNANASGVSGATFINATFNTGADGFTATQTSSSPTLIFANVASSTYSTGSTIDGTPFFEANSDAGGSGSSTQTILESPVVNTVGYSSGLTLDWDEVYDYYSAGSDNVHTDVWDGTSWVAVYTAPAADDGVYGTPVHHSVNISAYANAAMKVRFVYNSNWGFYNGIDNVNLSGSSSVPAVLWTATPSDPSLTGQTTSQTPSVTPTATTTYTVVATSSNGCTASGSVTVTYSPLTPPTISATSTTVCGGSPTTLDAGGPYDTYSWSNGTSVVGTSQTLTVSPTATTTYTVTVTNGACSATATQTINVYTVTPASVTSSATLPICAPNTTTLCVSPSTGWTSVVWNTTETTTCITAASSSTYSVTVTDANGCVQTASLGVVINPAPPTAVATASGPTNLCWDGTNVASVILNADTTGADAGASIVWNDILGTATDALYIDNNELTFSVNAVSSYGFNFTVTNSYGCSATSNTITVSTDLSPAITSLSATDGCPGDVITITGSNFTAASAVNFNGVPSTYTVVDDFTITATVPTAFGSGSITVISSTGTCSASASFDVRCGAPMVVNAKAFLQGFYIGGGAMSPAVLYQGVPTATGAEADTVQVEIYDETTFALAGLAKGILMVDGSLSLSVYGFDGNYYLAIRHRSSVLTWSATAVALSSTTPSAIYDFTTAASQNFASWAADDYSEGIYSIFSGDINQDEYVDANDYPFFDIDNSLGACCSYLTTDLNGDGFVDANDYPFFNINNDNGVFSIHP